MFYPVPSGDDAPPLFSIRVHMFPSLQAETASDSAHSPAKGEGNDDCPGNEACVLDIG